MHHKNNLLLKGVIWKLLLFGSTFFLNVSIANLLGASASGEFFYIINNLTFVIQILGLGLDTSLGYFNSKKEYEPFYLINFAISWSVITTLLFILFFFFGLTINIFSYNDNVYLLILFVFCSLLNGLISILYISSNRNVIPNLLPSILNFMLVGYLFFLAWHNESLLWSRFLNAYFITPCFVSLLLLIGIFYRGNFKFKPFSFDFRNNILSYSLQIFIFNFLINLVLRSDIWLVKSLSDANSLGNYIQTGKVVQLILLLPNLASFILLPILTQQQQEGVTVEENVIKLSNIYFFGSLLICIFFIATGFWLFPLVFGSSFKEMYATFILLVPGILFFSATYPIDAYFSSIDKNKENMKGAIYALLIMVILDLLLIPSYSIYGAAIGSSVAYSFFFFYLFVRFKRYYTFSIFQIFYGKSFKRIFQPFNKHES